MDAYGKLAQAVAEKRRELVTLEEQIKRLRQKIDRDSVLIEGMEESMRLIDPSGKSALPNPINGKSETVLTKTDMKINGEAKSAANGTIQAIRNGKSTDEALDEKKKNRVYMSVKNNKLMDVNKIRDLLESHGIDAKYVKGGTELEAPKTIS